MFKALLKNSKPYFKNVIKGLIAQTSKIPRPKLPENPWKNLRSNLLDSKKNLEDVPDLVYIKELSNSDVDFQNKFLKTLSEEYALEYNAYMFCIEMGAPRAAAAKVAKLKDKLNILGMKNAFKLAERHQRRLQKGNKRFDAKFKKVLAKGNRFLESQVQTYRLVH